MSSSNSKISKAMRLFGRVSRAPTSSKNIPTSSNPLDDSSLYVKQVVGKESELKNNEMKKVKFGDSEILLIKQNGKFSALGAQCTHYGVSLDKGVLGDGRVRCHWHGACFNTTNGDIEDFPGLDNLPCHQVNLKDGLVIVKANKMTLKSNKRQPNFIARDLSNTETYVVVGGGAAGVVCVQQLRKEGFSGRLILILGENCLPYDRVKLTKVTDIEHKAIILRSEEFYKERNIEILKGVQLIKINPKNKNLELSNKKNIHYDKVLLATGAKPKTLNCEGSTLKNIFTLRNINEAQAIRKATKPKSKIVIVGSSYIGLEAAVCLLKIGAEITIIGHSRTPLEHIYGAEVGERIQKIFEEKNVRFYNSSTVEKFVGKNKVKGVLIKGPVCEEVKANLVVVGVGVLPNTCYLEDIVKLKPNRTIPVNKFLETSLPDVYGAGDCVHAPILKWEATIGHWGLAQYHGKIAAQNMMGMKKTVETVPFFWSVFFGTSFRYCGFAPGFKKVTIRGSLEKLSFIAFYSLDDGNVGAVLTVGRDPIAATFGEELRRGIILEVGRIDVWLEKFEGNVKIKG